MKFLGIVIPDEIKFKRLSSGLERGWHMVETRFKKGHVPQNKGKKMREEVYQKAAPTMFKPGHLPSNTLHDGAITIRSYGSGSPKKYKYIRLAQGKWEPLHRHLWKQHYGEIPAGYNVQFKDGNQMNCNIDNLELISKRQNVDRNSIVRYPSEIRKSIFAVSKLQKTIRHHEKQNQY